MAFCPSCGAQVDGRFCQKCGATVDAGGVPPPGAAPAAGSAGLTDNAAGALCYLFGLITGILFLVISPYNTNRAVKFNAFQAIFFHVAMIAIWIVFFILSTGLHFIPVIGSMIALLLTLCLWIGGPVALVFLYFQSLKEPKAGVAHHLAPAGKR